MFQIYNIIKHSVENAFLIMIIIYGLILKTYPFIASKITILYNILLF